MSTIKDLKDILDRYPDTTTIYFQLATKEEVSDYFTEGQDISDDDWTSFCDDFTGDWEYAGEVISECVSSEYLCDSCGLYDYRCISSEGGETCCPHCGEETDILNVG